MKANVKDFLEYCKRVNFCRMRTETLAEIKLLRLQRRWMFGDFLMDLPPLYQKMGVLLNEMHKVEQKTAEDNSQPHPTIPPIRRPSRPHRKPAQTSSAPPLTASTNYRPHQTDLTERGPIERSPIEELVRFITVSALAQNIEAESSAS
jgi:hypothetical protein